MNTAHDAIDTPGQEFSRFAEMLGDQPQVFQTLMDIIPCGLCLVDSRGSIFHWNSAAEQITGIGKVQAIGQACQQVFNCPNFKRSCPVTHPHSIAAEPVSVDLTLNTKGRLVHLQKTSNYIRNADGRLICVIESFVDLTQQHEAEAAMQEGRELVESARQAKRHFMANMTHEIRTPLNGIMGLLDLMLAEDPAPAQQEHLASAKRSTRLLKDLVDDILDFTIIDKGAVDIEVTGFSLASIIGSVIARQYDLIQNRQVGIHSRVEEDVPDNLLGDSGRLYQILKHLVGNAIKFTPAGEVAVKVVRVPESVDAPANGSRQVMLHFSVGDTGVGIPEEKLDAIFESLSQVDAPLTRSVGGLGIGLNIVQRLVVLLGGRIWMESQVGRGTTVHFLLPFKSASMGEVEKSMGSPREPSTAAPLSNGEIIVASSRGTIKVDTYLGPGDRDLALAATPLSPRWLARFEALAQLLTHDKPAAEALLTDLKADAQAAQQGSTATLLFRLLLALRRGDRTAMDHFYSMIDQKIKSDPGVGDIPGSAGGTHEGVDR